ncbi:hypothetical protein LDENG_00139400 [Lucifuga dentata]|nr:hypothetical protein LDENG_00139400 [Lucifuga dentata]
MRGRYKRKDKGRNEETGKEAGLPRLRREAAVGSARPDSPVLGVTVQDADDDRKDGKCSGFGGEKVYLGVRVKMPVKDLLRNIRLARGWSPKDLQNYGKTAKGDKKRVKTCTECRTSKRKCLSKSLEELAIIIEVLEEDLKTGNACSSPPQTLSPPNPSESPDYPSQPVDFQGASEPLHSSCSFKYDSEMQMSRMSDWQLMSLSSSNDEFDSSSSYCSPRSISSHQGYSSDESEMIPSPQSCMSYSADPPENLVNRSPPDLMYSSLHPSDTDLHHDGNIFENGGGGGEWLGLQSHDWNLSSSAFFWTQLQKEENQLRDISDSMLLAADGQGRTALHKVACMGKRALGYAIAKRMAALSWLELRDSEGMTALHLAAKHNHHLMVADLIQLGASINQRNNCGRSCLHLSAENGYIRVLEVSYCLE